jgi:hypothetical protein
MGAIGLNPIRLDAIGLDPIRINAIKLGVPGASSATDRPYISPDVLSSLAGVWIADGKSNTDPDRNIIKNKLPGRGGDFEIFNAAYKLNSGFGKYAEDFSTMKDYGTKGIVRTSSKIYIDESFDYDKGFWLGYTNSPSLTYKVRVSGIPKDGVLNYTGGSWINLINGINELPARTNTEEIHGFVAQTPNVDWSKLVIEQIPENEGSFVTDGVNDMIVSQNPVSEMLDGSKELTVVSMIHQISPVPDSYGFTNYIREGSIWSRTNVKTSGKTGIYGYKISKGNTEVGASNLINNILGDKADYEAMGYNITNYSDINYSVAGYIKDGSPTEVSSVAWYWTFIAKRALTTDEINQVIAYYNLDKYVKPDIYYNVKKQGLTNDTPDEDWYLKDFSGNGRDMTLYNYARTPESGINEEGGLQSDGVVDYGQFVGDLGLKDYTVVIDRAYNNLINNQVPLISSNIVEDQTPFIVEHWNTGSNAISFSYGASRTTDIPLDINKKIVYQSTYSYMGYVIPKGNAISTGNGITLGKFGNGVQYSAICLWSLMLFPYSMSEFLIERQLKKHKLGTLYPNMVEFRPVIKANANYKITYYQIDSTNTWKSIKVGDYIVIGAKLAFQITFDNDASELKEVVSPQLSGIIVEKRPSNPGYNIYSYITSKSPQKINITIDEYIRYEDIVQPYPVLLRFNDENGNEVSWGGKFRVGSTITRIGSIADPESNLLNGLYSINGLTLNGKVVTSSTHIVEKQMVFKTTATYLLDDNEPKCILSPRLLRIPNSSYKILGHIPDISGHGNHSKINNSAYKLNSGVNGYLVDFTTLKDDGIKGIVRTDSKIYLDKSFNYNQGFWLGITNNPSPAYKVKVSGIPETGMLTYTGGVWLNLVNGINELPARTNTEEEHGFVVQSPNLDWSNLVIEQIGEYEGAYCLDGVDDFVTIPTTVGGKQVLMKVNWQNRTGLLYDQRKNGSSIDAFAILNVNSNSSIAYNSRNTDGKTYIDGILNTNIVCPQLYKITHNITIINQLANKEETMSPTIGSDTTHKVYFSQMALYDFMLFDNISTDDKIKQLNEYVGIEGNTEWRKTR